jgi:hypothetical protein
MRNVHDKTERAGQIGNKEFTKHHVFDMFTNMPDVTMRNVHDKNDRAGQVGNSEFAKAQAFDMFTNIPDTTMRNVHDKNDRAGQVGNSEFAKAQVFDMQANIPDATMRDIHDKTNYVAPPQRYESLKQTSRHDYTNALLDVTKDKISRLRAPVKSNFSAIPTFENTLVELANPIQINRELYPDIKQDPVLRNDLVVTREANEFNDDSMHFYTFIDENLRRNPLVNNLIHKSGVNV